MKYLAKKFSVAPSAGSPAYCAEHGHAMPDRYGKCVRCSAKVRHVVMTRTAYTHINKRFILDEIRR